MSPNGSTWVVIEMAKSVWPERTAIDLAAKEQGAIQHAAKVMLSPQEYTLDEYVEARDLIKTLAKEE